MTWQPIAYSTHAEPGVWHECDILPLFDGSLMTLPRARRAMYRHGSPQGLVLPDTRMLFAQRRDEQRGVTELVFRPARYFRSLA